MSLEDSIPPIEDFLYFTETSYPGERGYSPLPQAAVDFPKLQQAGRNFSIESIRKALKEPLDASRVVVALKSYHLVRQPDETRPNDVDRAILKLSDSKQKKYDAVVPKDRRSIQFLINHIAYSSLINCAHTAGALQGKALGIWILNSRLKEKEVSSAAACFYSLSRSGAGDNPYMSAYMPDLVQRLFEIIADKQRNLDHRKKVLSVLGRVYENGDQRYRSEIDEILQLHVGTLTQILRDPKEYESLKSEIRSMAQNRIPLYAGLLEVGTVPFIRE